MGIFAQPAIVKSQNQRPTLNLHFTPHHVSREQRGQVTGRIPGFRGCTVWLTGLSGAGKSSIALNVEEYLVSHGIPAYCLDGDNLRMGISCDLEFSAENRKEHVRRVAETAKLFADNGIVTLCSILSPSEEGRQLARKILEDDGIRFFEIFVNTSLEVCAERDVKGLYKKARCGMVKEFTGVCSAYEVPKTPDFIVNTENVTLQHSVMQVLDFLEKNGVIPKLVIPGRPVRELFVDPSRVTDLKRETENLESLEINDIDVQWLQVLAEGWAAPLKGFMRERQYLQVQHFNCLVENGVEMNQSVLIVLAASTADKERCRNQSALLLKHKGHPLAILRQPEFYYHRKEERCCRQFGTNDKGHPYVKIIHDSGDWLVGGDVEVFERIRWNDGLDRYRLTPNEIQAKCREVGADTIFAFQLRNPIHNGHALLMQDTRRRLIEERGYKKPMLLLHPLGGWTKDDDVPLHVRIEQHQAVLEEGILHPDTILAIFPSPMMYAGPTEVQWHAKARMMAGVNFYIVGRDPAGISHPNKYATPDGNLYDIDHGAKVLTMAPGLRGLEIIPFQVAAYDTKQKLMTFYDPQRKEDFEFISGTRMRAIAKSNGNLPEGFMSPKAWKILVRYYEN